MFSNLYVPLVPPLSISKTAPEDPRGNLFSPYCINLSVDPARLIFTPPETFVIVQIIELSAVYGELAE